MNLGRSRRHSSQPLARRLLEGAKGRYPPPSGCVDSCGLRSLRPVAHGAGRDEVCRVVVVAASADRVDVVDLACLTAAVVAAVAGVSEHSEPELLEAGGARDP